MTTHLNADLREFARRKEAHLEQVKDLRRRAADILGKMSEAGTDAEREALAIQLDAVLTATDNVLADSITSYQLAIQTIQQKAE